MPATERTFAVIRKCTELTSAVLDVACGRAPRPVAWEPQETRGAIMLFEKLWAQIKGAERSGKLTVEEALDCATRLPHALFCSMMECLAENGEDPQVIVTQVARLHDHMLKRLREVAATLRQRPPHGLH